MIRRTMRSSGLGGSAPMRFGWFSWFVLSVGQRSLVEAPKPLNAGVGREEDQFDLTTSAEVES